jgi:hypothetical protein
MKNQPTPAQKRALATFAAAERIDPLQCKLFRIRADILYNLKMRGFITYHPYGTPWPYWKITAEGKRRAEQNNQKET